MDKKHNYTNHGKSSKRLWITFLFFCIITTGFMQAANKVFAQATVTGQTAIHKTFIKHIGYFFVIYI